MYEIICPRCGQPFVLRDGMPQQGEIIAHQKMYHVDGRPVRASDVIKCDSCGTQDVAIEAMSPYLHPELWRPRENNAD